MPNKQICWRVFCELLDNGPLTTSEIIDRTRANQAGVQKAMRRLQRMEVIRLAGRGARRPGRTTGSTPYVLDIGPRIRKWAAANVKPPRDDE